MAKVKKSLGFGGALVTGERGDGNSLLDILRGIADDLSEVKAKFDAHKHRVDGSALGNATDLTGLPATGTTTGTPTGGTLSTISVSTERE